MKQITDFEGRTSDEVEVEYISTISGVIPVYSIKSYHSLTQFIGYGKYINNQWGNVYLRGQTSLYNGCLSPSLLRRKIISGENQLVKEKAEAATSNTVKFSNININHRFSEYKHQINESLNGTQHFTGWNKDIIEPLLQHYGIKTHWIDIVDNIWVALWFALHKTSSTIADGREYIHMFENDDDEYGYVLLIGCGRRKNNLLCWAVQKFLYQCPCFTNQGIGTLRKVITASSCVGTVQSIKLIHAGIDDFRLGIGCRRIVEVGHYFPS